MKKHFKKLSIFCKLLCGLGGAGLCCIDETSSYWMCAAIICCGAFVIGVAGTVFTEIANDEDADILLPDWAITLIGIIYAISSSDSSTHKRRRHRRHRR